MKKELGVTIILAVTVVLMSIAVRIKDNPAQSIKAFLSATMTDTDRMVKQQVPILAMANSEAVSAELHEEDEDTDTEIKIEIDSSYISPTVPKGNAKILIYHTHINEAYSQTDSYTYKETGSYRTKDKSKNVARIGEELKNLPALEPPTPVPLICWKNVLKRTENMTFI